MKIPLERAKCFQGVEGTCDPFGSILSPVRLGNSMESILRQWRTWVLAFLLIGPVLAYVGFGTIWLWEHSWLWIATLLWIVAGVAFSIFAARWTRSVHKLMPPLDWNSPNTFSPRDRDAWRIVEEEAAAGETLPLGDLMGPEIYMETGRRLLGRLASFYHPGVSHPLDEVPLVELLTAIELASEDLARLTRQVPGGDLLSLSHWRGAVQVAGYISKANDLYSLLSPILNPLSGLTRLGTRELLVKPAWRDMQQNILRWFYQAYVNRVGVHLIELMSGRLVIGADHYRKLTRRTALPAPDSAGETPLTAVVIGARGSGKSRLVQAIKQFLGGDPALGRARLGSLGLDPGLFDRLAGVRWVEVAGYPPDVEGESRRDRALRQAAVLAAVDSDILVLTVDGRSGLRPADVALAQAWDRHFIDHPDREPPPALVVITGIDAAEFGVGWSPPYDWSAGKSVREAAVRSLFDSMRASLPPTFGSFTAAGLRDETPFGVVEHLIPGLAAQMQKAERSALIRRLQSLSGRSKAGRLVSQLGQQARHVWGNLKTRHGARRSG
ncbi:MAG: GTPase [Isosphaeraceae bacterium]